MTLDVHTYIRVRRAESKMNGATAKAVFREELSMNIVINPAVKSCERFLDLSFVSDPAQVCWKYDLRAKREVLLFFLVHLNFVKRGQRLEKLLMAYNVFVIG